MAQGRDDGEIAPRRSLGGRILPPPPEELGQEARDAEQESVREEQARQEQVAQERAEQKRADRGRAEAEKASRRAAKKESAAARSSATAATPAPTRPSTAGMDPAVPAPTKAASRPPRRAQLRLVQIDAWSVMKTSFLLSIAFGIVLVVAVSIIWAVLGAAGVWDSINSIVQQAVGGAGDPFDITQYLGTSRVLGFTMVVAVVDVVLITAIATLGAFLYNLAAALLGGIEVTLAEDS